MTAPDVTFVYGTAALQNTGAFAPASHSHAISGVTGLQDALDAKSGTSHNHSGVYQPVPTGTPDGTKYLRDDNSWQAVSGGSGLTAYQVRTLTLRGR